MGLLTQNSLPPELNVAGVTNRQPPVATSQRQGEPNDPAAGGPTTPTYCNGSNQVLLHPSAALVVRPDSMRGSLGETAERLTAVVGAPQTMVLYNERLILVLRPEPEPRTESEIEHLLGAAQAELGPPVFEVEGFPSSGMVPTPELLVRFAANVSPAQRAKLLIERRLIDVDPTADSPGGLRLVRCAGWEHVLTESRELHNHDVVDHAEPNFLHVCIRPHRT